MSSIMPISQCTMALLALLAALPSTQAAPLTRLYKREMGTGAKAGLGVGIAVIALIVVSLVAFFIVHFRRRAHLSAINKERAILAGEKNTDGSDKPDMFASQPPASGMPRRNKSVKDRLMGPLYRGSTIDMLPMPKPSYNPNRSSTMTTQSGESAFVSKPWAPGGESSPRPSFSSKRATRMMMMM